MLALELLDEVVDKAVIEVLTTKMSVTGGRLDFEDTLLDGQEGNIECSSSEIEDEDITLTDGLLSRP